MDENKRESFVFRKSFYEPIKILSTNDRGILIDAICNYAFDDIEPENLSPVLKMAFGFIISTIERDNAKYQSVIERNTRNGRSGGRPKNPLVLKESEEPKEPTGLLTNPPESEEPKEPKKAECDCVCVSDCDCVSVSDSHCEREKENSSPFDFFLTQNEIFNRTGSEFLNSDMWFDTKAMQLGSTRIQIHESSKEFILDLRDRDMLEGKTLIDLRSHFVSWFKKHQPKAINGSSFIPKASDR